MSLQSTARIVNKSGANVVDPRGWFNRDQARKYSLPRGNATVYSLGRLANFIGCKASDIWSASPSAIHRGIIVTFLSGLQTEVPVVYLQEERELFNQ